MKILLTALALMIPVATHAVCDTGISWVTGEIPSASKFNTHTSNLESCSNDILDGDTYTGNSLYHSGADLLLYSDTGSTLEAAIYGNSGDNIMCPSEIGGVNNLDMTLASGVVTVTCGGSACSAANPGFVRASSTTAGLSVCLKVTASPTFTDDVGTSDLTNLGYGVTETVAWANDVPFFISVVNRANSDIDGADGSSIMSLARNPALVTTSSSGDNIGDTGAVPVNDSQNVILLMDDVTIANYTSLPMQLVGGLRMQWSTVTDDWTVQTLGNGDGMSRAQLDKLFATEWTMPLAQNGAATGTYMTANSGTAALFTTNTYTYRIDRFGMVDPIINLQDDPGTDGAGAVTTQIVLPTANVSSASSSLGMVRDISVGGGAAQQFVMAFIQTPGNAFFSMVESTGGLVQNGDFSNGARSLIGTLRYQGFDSTP